MQMFFPGDLTALNAAQKASPFANQGVAETGDQQAFQLLLESMLFQTVAKELFQGKGGLLAGIGLGLFQEEGQESTEHSDNFLSLLELLQFPLMEQLRPVQEEIGGNEALVKTLISTVEEQENTEFLTDLLKEWQQLQNSLDTSEEKGNILRPPLQDSAFTNNNREAPLSSINQNIQEEQKVDLKTDVLTAKPSGDKVESFSQAFGEQNAVTAESGDGTAKVSVAQDLPDKISYRSISEQIIQSGKLKLLGEKQEIEIQLKPEYLGKLALKVTAENGVLTARFLVENHQVSRMLDQNLANIRQTLAEQGISLEQVQVEVGDPRSNFQEQQKAWSERQEKEDSQSEPFETAAILEELLNPQEMLAKIGIDYRA